FPSVHSHPGDEILRLGGVWEAGNLHDMHLRLRRGEIIGLTGLMGAGRTELARVIFGADQPDGGKIVFQGKEVVLKSPRQAIDSGIGLLTEDRKTQGLVLNMLLRENTTLANLSRLVRRGFINIAEEKSVTRKFIQDLFIKTPSTEQRVRNLSGGTQQKVVLAKWLFTQSQLLIF